ncbi:hypothetical protein ACHAXS_010316 [Conticribra weissflogii]
MTNGDEDSSSHSASVSSGNGNSAGRIRRRPPTAPYSADVTSGRSSSASTIPPPPTQGYSPSNQYGTYEGDSLLHASERGCIYHDDREAQNSHGMYLTYDRRHHIGSYPSWYRQPQKVILVATLAWVGGVMYLASLAHSILRTQKAAMHSNMMGMSNSGGVAVVGKVASSGTVGSSSTISDGVNRVNSMGSNGRTTRKGDNNERVNVRFGMENSADFNEGFREWLEAQKSNKYGSSAGSVVSQGGGIDVNYEAYLDFLHSYQTQTESSKNQYGSSNGGNASGQSAGNDNNYQAFLEWMESHQNKFEASKNKYGGSTSGGTVAQEGGVDVNYEVFLEWLDSFQSKAESSKNTYGANSENRNDYANDADFKNWLKSFDPDNVKSNAYGSSQSGTGNSGNRAANDPSYKEWLEYQKQTASVKYGANGMYGDEISTIDWPMRLASTENEDGTVSNNNLRLPHVSCTTQNGCTPSSNVTILVVYGPEYHTHISEMAWNVASGVHSALKSHIQHHPYSPLHGHIVFGHTSNLTFLDVLDADAIIIGSPVYNGNVHPDVQNWINYWHIDADLSNKFGGAFVTAGGLHAGADGTIMSILRSMMVFQMMAVGGDSWTSPFGVAATMHEDPFGDVQRSGYFNKSCYFTEQQGRQGDHLVHPYFLSKARGLGERIANVTVAWKNSSYVRW